jgi:hypothetical protein
MFLQLLSRKAASLFSVEVQGNQTPPRLAEFVVPSWFVELMARVPTQSFSRSPARSVSAGRSPAFCRNVSGKPAQ